MSNCEFCKTEHHIAVDCEERLAVAKGTSVLIQISPEELANNADWRALIEVKLANAGEILADRLGFDRFDGERERRCDWCNGSGRVSR